MSVDSILKNNINKHGTQRKNLLPLLQELAIQERWLSKTILKKIAKEFKISPAEVYSVASFYSFLKTKAQGKNTIRICKSISCDLRNKESIVEAVQEKLQIRPGETTQDGMFSFEEVNCIGWCHKGPAMLINDKVYTELTPDKVNTIIDDYISQSPENLNSQGGEK